jgi:UDP-N-acetylmuramate--alanine ligase
VAFERFVRTLPDDGLLVICGDDPGSKLLLQRLTDAPFSIMTYGKEPQNNICVEAIAFDEGLPRGQVSVNERSTSLLRLQVYGEHNLMNALSVVGVALHYGIALTDVCSALGQFHGTKRRMELIGIRQGVKVYDDYGHHPAEVRTTLKAMRQKEAKALATGKRLICVYQPHLYSRTELLLDEIEGSFDDADLVLVPKICGAREKDPGTINSQMVVDRINKHYGSDKAILTPEFEDIVAWLQANAKPDEVVMTTSCGDIWKAAKMFYES